MVANSRLDTENLPEETTQEPNQRRSFRLSKSYRHIDSNPPASLSSDLQSSGMSSSIHTKSKTSPSTATLDYLSENGMTTIELPATQLDAQQTVHCQNVAAALAILDETGLTGVTYDFTSRAWRASYRDETSKRLVYVGHFTLKMFGDVMARELAFLAKVNCQKFKELGKEAFRAWVIDLHKSIKGVEKIGAVENGQSPKDKGNEGNPENENIEETNGDTSELYNFNNREKDTEDKAAKPSVSLNLQTTMY